MIAAAIRLFTGVRARWIDVEPLGSNGRPPQRVYFANHHSNLDAPVIWASLPGELRKNVRPVAARDYWDRGLVRRLLAERVFRCVLIERQHVTRRHNPLQPMETALRDGASLIIFPEGTRNRHNDHMAEFKSGIWHLARDFPQVEFMPVYLENLNRILPKGDFLPVPVLASVRFGPPLVLKEREAKQDFLQRARLAIESLQQGQNA